MIKFNTDMQKPGGKRRFKVAGCFLEYDGRFLMLRRSPDQHQGGKWGLPAGRVEQGEAEADAAIREVHEETGFSIPPDKLEFLQKITFPFPEKIIDFFVYRTNLDSKIKIVLDPHEHQEYAWVTGKEYATRNDLMDGVRTLFGKNGACVMIFC